MLNISPAIRKSIITIFTMFIGAVLLFGLASTALAQGPGGRANRGNGQGRGWNMNNAGQRANCLYDGVCLNADNLPPAVDLQPSEEVIEALNSVLQDEYNAYNFYQGVIDQFAPVRPFTNIQQAEQRHIDALAVIYERYDIPMPQMAPLSEIPQFTSIADACQLGVEAEIGNFDLYDAAMETVEDYPDMVQVFTALRDASEFRHLPALDRCASRWQ